MGIKIEITEMYEEWFEEQTAKFQAQIMKRLENIELHGHFGTVRQLDSNLAEIKFNNGVRIYFTTRTDSNGKTILLLLGGNKNGQDKDIKKAKSLLS